MSRISKIYSWNGTVEAKLTNPVAADAYQMKAEGKTNRRSQLLMVVTPQPIKEVTTIIAVGIWSRRVPREVLPKV